MTQPSGPPTVSAPDSQPLRGLRVLATRPAEQISKLSRALRAEGADVLEVPAIAIEPPSSWEAVDDSIHQGHYHWVIFTSTNGVRFFFGRLAALGQDTSWFAGGRIAAIGPETARALAPHGLSADLVPDEFVAEALLAALTDAGPLHGERVLLARADIAREALVTGLLQEGALVDQVTVYRTVPAQPSSDLLNRLTEGTIDVVTFTSSSTVRSLVDMLGSSSGLLPSCTVACIGPVTAATARELGLEPAIVATNYTIPGLIDAIRHHYLEITLPPNPLPSKGSGRG